MGTGRSDDERAWPAGRVDRFRRYWREITDRLGRPPTRRELDPLGFPAALAWILLLEYHRSAHRLRCRLAGDEIMKAFGWREARRRWLDAIMLPEEARTGTDLARRVLDDGTPLFGHRVVAVAGPRSIDVLRGAFPLCRIDGEPEMLVVVYQQAREVPATPFERDGQPPA